MAAEHAGGMTIWQFTRFRVGADREAAVLLAREASTRPSPRPAYRGFRSD
jgi:hypothetical protein